MSNKENTMFALHVLDILKKHSDEDNILPLNRMLQLLEQKGIVRERRAIYEIIDKLRDYGYEISDFKDNSKGYYLMDREFDKHEIRILIDAIATSKSITTKKSNELVEKLLRLASDPAAKRLKKQVYVEDNVKCMNEQIYINIDSIGTAINQGKKISFIYYDYNVHKEHIPRKEGRRYIENPVNMVLNNGFYYLITYKNYYDEFTHYRVDRMKNIEIEEAELDNSYLNKEEFKNGFNTALYAKKAFNMFSGEEGKVEIKIHNALLNMVIDQFGCDVSMYKLDEDHFKVIIDASISDGLVMWIMQYGGKAEVLYPEELRDRVRDEIVKLSEVYNC